MSSRCPKITKIIKAPVYKSNGTRNFEVVSEKEPENIEVEKFRTMLEIINIFYERLDLLGPHGDGIGIGTAFLRVRDRIVSGSFVPPADRPPAEACVILGFNVVETLVGKGIRSELCVETIQLSNRRTNHYRICLTKTSRAKFSQSLALVKDVPREDLLRFKIGPMSSAMLYFREYFHTLI